MTRHTLLENFDNFREVGLAKGDLVIVLECDRYGDKGGDAWRHSGLEKAGGYYHVSMMWIVIGDVSRCSGDGKDSARSEGSGAASLTQQGGGSLSLPALQLS